MSRLIRDHRENKHWMDLLGQVRARIEKVLEKHGEPSGDRVRISAVLAEEVGELAQVALDMSGRNSPGHPNATEIRFHEELVDIVAYGLLVLHRRRIENENQFRATTIGG